MARYFMTGTRYEDYERMMMSTDRKGRDERDDQDKPFTDRQASQREAIT